MTIYLTKVWGFSEPVGPLQFSMEGWRDRARREQIKPSDLVILVGTKGNKTDDEDRGIILGMMEPTTEPVMALDFDLPTRPEDYDAENNYKWPYGLLNLRAWSMIDRRPLSEISDRRFNMDSAAGLVPLTPEEADKVMALRRKPAQLLQPTIRARSRIEGTAAARRMNSPPPSTARRGVMHMRRASAYTYAMEIIGPPSPAFKVGWAFDYKLRARQFNQSAMPELGGLKYKPVLYHLWDTAKLAYSMEQKLLQEFKSHRHSANREIIQGITYQQLQTAWLNFMSKKSLPK